MPMRAFESDEYLKSGFRVEWLDPEAGTTVRDDLERAVAEKATHVLRAAKAAHEAFHEDGTELEVRVWLETATWPAFVQVQVDPRRGKHYFIVMDAQGSERLAAVVFDRVPSLTAHDLREESRLFFDAVKEAFTGGEEVEAGEFIDRVQAKVHDLGARDAVQQ